MMKVSESTDDLDALMQKVRADVKGRKRPQTHEVGPMPTPLEVDEILSRIRRELAAARNHALDPAASAGVPIGNDLQVPSGLSILSVEVPPELELRKNYRLAELLEYHDGDFVRAAYRAMLGRSPDPGGFEHYRWALASGRLSKVEILGRLRFTAEGRANSAHVTGLMLRYAGRLAFRIPVFGSLLGACYYALRLPTLVGSIDRLQGHVEARARLYATQTNLALRGVDELLRSEQAAIQAKFASVLSEQEKVQISFAESLAQNATETRRDLTTSVEAALTQLDSRLRSHARGVMDEVDNKLAQLDSSYAARIDASVNGARVDLQNQFSSELGALEARTAGQAQMAAVIADTTDLRQRLGLLQNEIATTIPNQMSAMRMAVADIERRLNALEYLVDATIVPAIETNRSSALESNKRIDAALATLAARLDQDSGLSDEFYAAFEDSFRGTREDIKGRVGVYLPYLREAGVGGADRAILDVGCGRGEWLEVLREQGLHARGVDLNTEMVRRCVEMGLAADAGDALECMQGLPDASLGGVVSFHVIEHLPIGTLVAIVKEAVRVLQPGGVLIMETPNPENLVVGACSFYTDFTHRRPIPPLALKFLVESCGFAQTEILRLHPLAVQTDEGLNELPSLVREAFTGAQDYAVIAHKA